MKNATKKNAKTTTKATTVRADQLRAGDRLIAEGLDVAEVFIEVTVKTVQGETLTFYHAEALEILNASR